MKRSETFEMLLAVELGPCISQNRIKSNKYKSKRAFAKYLGTSAQFWGRIEKGEVPVPDRLLAKAVQALNIPQEELMQAYLNAAVCRGENTLSKINFGAKGLAC